MRHVVVFDTNVLFSGIGWKGKPAQCLDLARSGTIEAITCEEIVDELAEKLAAKLSFSAEAVTETLAELLSFLHVVKITNQLNVVAADPDDDKVLECATVGGATHIVTGDKRHLLPLGSYQGIPIVTPANFLQVVSSAP
jgi:putative PIN family toxin of toxin-antitoxin system